MMRKLLALVFLISSIQSYSQFNVVPRSTGSNTVQDIRVDIKSNLFIPKYFDTTAANLAKGIDSSGAIIKTYLPDAIWVRGSYPKRWMNLLPTGSLGSLATVATTGDYNDLNNKPVISATATTLAQLRAKTTTTGAVYDILDYGGGKFLDKGLNDGVHTDNTGTRILSANNHYLERQFDDSTLNVMWFGVTGDGNTDEASKIQSILDIGGLIKFPKPIVNYLIGATLTVHSNTHIIGLNKPTFRLKNTANKIMFNIVDATNVFIDGLTLDGNIANQDKTGTDPLNLPEFWSGINLLNSNNVTITNNLIKNTNGDGITLEGRYISTAKSNTNKNITITDNEIFHSGRNGISVIHADGFVIARNTIYDNKAYTSTLGSGIDVEPNVGNGSEVWVARNGSITNNTIYDNNEGINLAGSSVTSSQIFENIKIASNNVYSNKVRNVYIFSLDNTKFITSGIILSNNNFKGDSTLTNNVFFNSCHSNIIFSGNDISNSITGILLYRSSEVAITGSNIENFGGTGGGSGIELFGSSNNNLKLNKIKNGNSTSNFLYGIAITSAEQTFDNADNSIENNEISVTATGKHLFAGIVAVSNDPSWNLVNRNKINGNTFDGITAANVLFVNTKVSSNEVGVNYNQGKSFVGDNALNTLVPYQFTSDRAIETTDLTLNNNALGTRVFDNTKRQPIWWNGSKWITGLIDGYNYGAKEVKKVLTSSFPDGVPNQKIDVLLPSSYFMGDIDLSIQSGFLGVNAAGVISKKFSVGYNPGGSIYSNNSRYTEAAGGIVDNFSVSELVWDAALSRYKITINHLTPTINPITVKLFVSSIDTGSTRVLYDSVSLGSVYVGSPSIANAAVEFKNPVRGVNGLLPNDFIIKSQLDRLSVTDFGAIPDDNVDDAPAINAAIAYAKSKRDAKTGKKGTNLTVYFPTGKYIASSPIFGAIGVDLVGAGKNNSIIAASTTQGGGIIMNEAGQEADPILLHTYTTIKDLGIMGGDYLNSPFASKDDGGLDHSASIGIDIHNHRIRVIECSIEGWSNVGIQAASVYYIYVDKSYISNNKIGYNILNTSTSNYLTGSELRFNSVGLVISNNSFANFVSNNLFESNIGVYLPYEIVNSGIVVSTGKAIIIDGSSHNSINNNYFENHVVTLTLHSATNNNFNENYIVPATTNPGHTDNIADIVGYYGGANGNNKFINNKLAFGNETQKASIRVLDAGINYSSDYYSFSKVDFDKVITDNLTTWQSEFSGIEANAPVFADEASGTVYRKLQIDNVSKWNNVTGGIEYPLTGRVNGNFGVGMTENPITKFEVKAAPAVHLGVRTGELNGSAIQLNAFNDGGAANIPMELKTTTLQVNIAGASGLKIKPDLSAEFGLTVSGQDGTAPSNYVTNSKLNAAIASVNTASASQFKIAIPAGVGIPVISVSSIDSTVTGKRFILEGQGVNIVTNNDSLIRYKIAPRIATNVTTAVLTPDFQFDDGVKVLALASDVSIANPIGTGTGFQTIIIRIKDNGTARAISWGTKYRPIGVTLPTTTVAGKLLYVEARYNADDNGGMLDVLRVNQEL